jgi:hypothetical protein
MAQDEVKKAAIKLIENATEENRITVSMSREAKTIDNGEFLENKQGPGKIIIEIYLPA